MARTRTGSEKDEAWLVKDEAILRVSQRCDGVFPGLYINTIQDGGLANDRQQLVGRRSETRREAWKEHAFLETQTLEKAPMFVCHSHSPLSFNIM